MTAEVAFALVYQALVHPLLQVHSPEDTGAFIFNSAHRLWSSCLFQVENNVGKPASLTSHYH